MQEKGTLTHRTGERRLLRRQLHAGKDLVGLLDAAKGQQINNKLIIILKKLIIINFFNRKFRNLLSDNFKFILESDSFKWWFTDIHIHYIIDFSFSKTINKIQNK